jgi:hypothetical protein
MFGTQRKTETHKQLNGGEIHACKKESCQEDRKEERW